jgi:hypothetical protein
MVVDIKIAYLLEYDILQSGVKDTSILEDYMAPFFRVQVNEVGNVMVVCYCRIVVTIYRATMSHPISP